MGREPGDLEALLQVQSPNARKPEILMPDSETRVSQLQEREGEREFIFSLPFLGPEAVGWHIYTLRADLPHSVHKLACQAPLEMPSQILRIRFQPTFLRLVSLIPGIDRHSILFFLT
jgi:hypothetical protein